jgi:ATP-dependent helicase/nuclease subunit A
MLITPSEVIIVDYKSDKSPPSREKNIPDSYYQQLLVYKKMVKEIYPTQTISTMILWLENGTLQEIA